MTEDLEARIRDDIARACAAFPTPGNSSGVFYLTAKEISVFRLLGLGLTNDELAERLAIEKSTIRTHLKRIHDKCDIQSRSRLALVSCHIWHLKPESRKELPPQRKG